MNFSGKYKNSLFQVEKEFYLLDKTDFLCYFYKFEKLLNIIDMEMIYGTEILLSGKNRKRVQQPH